MDKRVYFDTNAFRAIGKALGNAALSEDLRDRVLVSPLSAFEALSQLCTTQGEEVLRQIQAIHNWVDPKRAGLLPWPDDALGITGFGKKVMDADFTQRMQTAFNVCLAADSVESLKEEACKLRDVMDAMKLKFAQNFGRLLKAAKTEASKREDSKEEARRQGVPATDWFSNAWFQGIVNRLGVDPNSRSIAEIESTFNAYREFERVKLLTALANENYSPERHGNDLLDAEQLVYLGSPELHFLTCDKGFARVEQSAQATRIIIVSPNDLSEREKVETQLRKVTDQGKS